MSILSLSCDWGEYELLDSGYGEKLESFAGIALVRPEPQAVWRPHYSSKEWNNIAHARFIQKGSHSGDWNKLKPIPDFWVTSFCYKPIQVKFRLALTAFKHIGIFPEQSANWVYLAERCFGINKPKVLNLFAYTGGASLVASASGAQVTHVDAIKQVVNWAKNNEGLIGESKIRWIVDDALKFVEREVRRGNLYNGIILDPPAFGHGPNGERWIMEEHIDQLISTISKLIHPEEHFVIFNAYSLGFSSLILVNLLQYYFPHINNLEFGELYLKEKGRFVCLPAGVFARFYYSAKPDQG